LSNAVKIAATIGTFILPGADKQRLMGSRHVATDGHGFQ
jgi:hypothetical protein